MPVASKRPAQTSHRVRTILASLCGTLAISLILSSLVLVWLNRTLTDTPTFVKTVAPLSTKPEIQNFIAQKTSEQLVKNTSAQELANLLLPNNQVAGQAAAQLQGEMQPIIYKNILAAVQSPQFSTLWKTTNQTVHSALINQLNSNSEQVTIDFNPVMAGVVEQLKTTQLAPVADNIVIEENAAKVNLTDTRLKQAHDTYVRFHQATWLVVVVTVLLLVASVWLSVHHVKTFRRIAMGAGLGSLLFSLSIYIATHVSLGNTTDALTQKATAKLLETLLHNLQISSLILGIVCVSLAILSKIYSVVTEKKATPKS
ncbi:MAG: hypothetical protein QG553_529 [Patescibacteria group bacterium]|nr:hypothetical protein [Patescibacteria group bacterium]